MLLSGARIPPHLWFVPLSVSGDRPLVPCADVWFGHHRPPPAMWHPETLTLCTCGMACAHLEAVPGPARPLATAFAVLHAWGGGGDGQAR